MSILYNPGALPSAEQQARLGDAESLLRYVAALFVLELEARAIALRRDAGKQRRTLYLKAKCRTTIRGPFEMNHAALLDALDVTSPSLSRRIELCIVLPTKNRSLYAVERLARNARIPVPQNNCRLDDNVLPASDGTQRQKRCLVHSVPSTLERACLTSLALPQQISPVRTKPTSFGDAAN